MERTRYSKLAEITQLINSKLDLRESLEQVVMAISEEIVQCDSHCFHCVSIRCSLKKRSTFDVSCCSEFEEFGM